MLLTPRAKDKPMLNSLHQVIRENDGSSIPLFIDHGLRALFEDAADSAMALQIKPEAKVLEAQA